MISRLQEPAPDKAPVPNDKAAVATVPIEKDDTPDTQIRKKLQITQAKVVHYQKRIDNFAEFNTTRAKVLGHQSVQIGDSDTEPFHSSTASPQNMTKREETPMQLRLHPYMVAMNEQQGIDEFKLGQPDCDALDAVLSSVNIDSNVENNGQKRENGDKNLNEANQNVDDSLDQYLLSNQEHDSKEFEKRRQRSVLKDQPLYSITQSMSGRPCEHTLPPSIKFDEVRSKLDSAEDYGEGEAVSTIKGTGGVISIHDNNIMVAAHLPHSPPATLDRVAHAQIQSQFSKLTSLSQTARNLKLEGGKPRLFLSPTGNNSIISSEQRKMMDQKGVLGLPLTQKAAAKTRPFPSLSQAMALSGLSQSATFARTVAASVPSMASKQREEVKMQLLQAIKSGRSQRAHEVPTAAAVASAASESKTSLVDLQMVVNSKQLESIVKTQLVTRYRKHLQEQNRRRREEEQERLGRQNRIRQSKLENAASKLSQYIRSEPIEATDAKTKSLMKKLGIVRKKERNKMSFYERFSNGIDHADGSGSPSLVTQVIEEKSIVRHVVARDAEPSSPADGSDGSQQTDGPPLPVHHSQIVSSSVQKPPESSCHVLTEYLEEKDRQRKTDQRKSTCMHVKLAGVTCFCRDRHQDESLMERARAHRLSMPTKLAEKCSKRCLATRSQDLGAGCKIRHSKDNNEERRSLISFELERQKRHRQYKRLRDFDTSSESEEAMAIEPVLLSTSSQQPSVTKRGTMGGSRNSPQSKPCMSQVKMRDESANAFFEELFFAKPKKQNRIQKIIEGDRDYIEIRRRQGSAEDRGSIEERRAEAKEVARRRSRSCFYTPQNLHYSEIDRIKSLVLYRDSMVPQEPEVIESAQVDLPDDEDHSDSSVKEVQEQVIEKSAEVTPTAAVGMASFSLGDSFSHKKSVALLSMDGRRDVTPLGGEHKTSKDESGLSNSKIEQQRNKAVNLRSVNVTVAGKAVSQSGAPVTEVALEHPRKKKVRTYLGDNVIFPATAPIDFEMARDQKLRIQNQRLLGVKRDGTLDSTERAPPEAPQFSFDGSPSDIKQGACWTGPFSSQLVLYNRMAGQHIFYDDNQNALSADNNIKIMDKSAFVKSSWCRRATSDFEKIISNRNTNMFVDMRLPGDPPLVLDHGPIATRSSIRTPRNNQAEVEVGQDAILRQTSSQDFTTEVTQPHQESPINVPDLQDSQMDHHQAQPLRGHVTSIETSVTPRTGGNTSPTDTSRAQPVIPLARPPVKPKELEYQLPAHLSDLGTRGMHAYTTDIKEKSQLQQTHGVLAQTVKPAKRRTIHEMLAAVDLPEEQRADGLMKKARLKESSMAEAEANRLREEYAQHGHHADEDDDALKYQSDRIKKLIQLKQQIEDQQRSPGDLNDSSLIMASTCAGNKDGYSAFVDPVHLRKNFEQLKTALSQTSRRGSTDGSTLLLSQPRNRQDVALNRTVKRAKELEQADYGLSVQPKVLTRIAPAAHQNSTTRDVTKDQSSLLMRPDNTTAVSKGEDTSGNDQRPKSRIRVTQIPIVHKNDSAEKLQQAVASKSSTRRPYNMTNVFRVSHRAAPKQNLDSDGRNKEAFQGMVQPVMSRTMLLRQATMLLKKVDPTSSVMASEIVSNSDLAPFTQMSKSGGFGSIGGLKRPSIVDIFTKAPSQVNAGDIPPSPPKLTRHEVSQSQHELGEGSRAQPSMQQRLQTSMDKRIPAPETPYNKPCKQLKDKKLTPSTMFRGGRMSHSQNRSYLY